MELKIAVINLIGCSSEQCKVSNSNSSFSFFFICIMMLLYSSTSQVLVEFWLNIFSSVPRTYTELLTDHMKVFASIIIWVFCTGTIFSFLILHLSWNVCLIWCLVCKEGRGFSSYHFIGELQSSQFGCIFSLYRLKTSIAITDDPSLSLWHLRR